MCVASTCKRRRREMRLDKRFRKRDPQTMTARAARRAVEERARQQRMANKGKR